MINGLPINGMVKNFLFHRVNPTRDILWDPLDLSLFDKCIRYISSHFHIVLLEDLFQNDFDFSIKKKYATILFDDGYKDNLEYALPILEKYNVRASFYVVTDCIEKNIPTWTYILDYAFQYTNKKNINLEFDFLPEELRVNELPGNKERIEYVKKLKPVIKNISHEDRLRVITAVTESFDDVELPGLMMNWDDLRLLRSKGHYIGSHTVSHSMLGTMTNETEIKKELVESGEKIKLQLGYFPSTISYPVGSYNKTTIQLSKAAGYKIGLAVKQQPYDPGKHDCFEIPRIELYNEPWFKTRLRIASVLGTISKVLKRV
jgi:peptidoglycan/xylan/chitin deacetylase (PgdA/CDA1 family)